MNGGTSRSEWRNASISEGPPALCDEEPVFFAVVDEGGDEDVGVVARLLVGGYGGIYGGLVWGHG